MVKKRKKDNLLRVLAKIDDELERYYKRIDALSDNCDTYFSDALEDIRDLKRPWLKTDKRKAVLIRALNKKMPGFSKLLNEFDLVVEAMRFRIKESWDKLEETTDTFDEIESLQEQIADINKSIKIIRLKK
jgi:hypothetical protein